MTTQPQPPDKIYVNKGGMWHSYDHGERIPYVSLTLYKEAIKALRDLTFTAQKLWDDTPKPIMSGGAITVTHPIIEQAKQILTKSRELL